jgi:hypothetical protein
MERAVCARRPLCIPPRRSRGAFNRRGRSASACVVRDEASASGLPQANIAPIRFVPAGGRPRQSIDGPGPRSCQSAFKFDPSSASNFVPFERRGLVVARLVGAGRDCGDETSAGCVIVVAAFESPAVIAGLDDVTVMGQAIEQRVRVATQSSHVHLGFVVLHDTRKHCLGQQLLATSVSNAWRHLVDTRWTSTRC